MSHARARLEEKLEDPDSGVQLLDVLYREDRT